MDAHERIHMGISSQNRECPKLLNSGRIGVPQTVYLSINISGSPILRHLICGVFIINYRHKSASQPTGMFICIQFPTFAFSAIPTWHNPKNMFNMTWQVTSNEQSTCSQVYTRLSVFHVCIAQPRHWSGGIPQWHGSMETTGEMACRWVSSNIQAGTCSVQGSLPVLEWKLNGGRACALVQGMLFHRWRSLTKGHSVADSCVCQRFPVSIAVPIQTLQQCIILHTDGVLLFQALASCLETNAGQHG